MIRYPKYAPSTVKCPECGHTGLEIWAFDNGTSYEPVLVCEKRCHTFFDPESCGTTPKELQI